MAVAECAVSVPTGNALTGCVPVNANPIAPKSFAVTMGVAGVAAHATEPVWTETVKERRRVFPSATVRRAGVMAVEGRAGVANQLNFVLPERAAALRNVR